MKSAFVDPEKGEGGTYDREAQAGQLWEQLLSQLQAVQERHAASNRG